MTKGILDLRTRRKANQLTLLNRSVRELNCVASRVGFGETRITRTDCTDERGAMFRVSTELAALLEVDHGNY